MLKNPFSSGKEDVFHKTADELALEAVEDFNVGNYQAAATKFDEIKNRYPFHPRAMLAELKSADCQYYQEKYAEAKLLYQEFQERHPTNEAIPYVIFQIGMCSLSQTDRIDKNVNGAKEAIQSFTQLLRAFPDSPYAKEAKTRIKAAREFIVNHEFYVAIFYLRTNKINEAAYRLKYILNTYPDSTITPKAKELLGQIESGNPPRLGIYKLLPDILIPNQQEATTGYSED